MSTKRPSAQDHVLDLIPQTHANAEYLLTWHLADASCTYGAHQGLLQTAATQQPQLLDGFRMEVARQLSDTFSAVGQLIAGADTGATTSSSPATSTALQVI
jgi:hypothetical protein